MFGLLDMSEEKIKSLNPLNLAFIGDSVFDIIVKQFLVSLKNAKVNELHKQATQMLCCKAQSGYIEKIWPILTEDEKNIYKRGRNCKTSHTPKQAANIEYHRATGFEALIGYLYLRKNENRIKTIVEKALEECTLVNDVTPNLDRK